MNNVNKQMTHRQKQALATRTLIVDTSRDLFLEQGYGVTTIEAIRVERTFRRQVPRTVAVLRYSGRWTERNYIEHRDELLAALAKAGIKPVGEPWLARYNAPFSLPMFRRNEALVEVERLPD